MFLELKNLTKRYVAPEGSIVNVLNIPAFSLDAGQQVALKGGSGSGKTTLLHIIAGILLPDTGEVLFSPNGTPRRNICSLSEGARDAFRGRHIGYIFQTHHLLPGLSAMENVMLGMTFTGRSADPAWAKKLLTLVGLSDRLNYKPEKLSVGQQQRIAIARALANKPDLVLADEPTGALDSVNAEAAIKLIRSLCTEVNAALLLVSHDPAITGQFQTLLNLSDLNRKENLQ